MSKSLAAEIASRNVTVNCVAPGFIRTPMTDALTEDQQQAIYAKIPAGGDGHARGYRRRGGSIWPRTRRGYVTGQTLQRQWRHGDDLGAVLIWFQAANGR